MITPFQFFISMNLICIGTALYMADTLMGMAAARAETRLPRQGNVIFIDFNGGNFQK